MKEFGTLLRAQIRGGDIAARYGGEEFILILPETLLNETVGRAEELRQAVKRLNVEHRGQTLDMITASFGVASFPVRGFSMEGLLQAADDSLYRAKKEGRDRVVVSAH